MPAHRVASARRRHPATRARIAFTRDRAPDRRCASDRVPCAPHIESGGPRRRAATSRPPSPRHGARPRQGRGREPGRHQDPRRLHGERLPFHFPLVLGWDAAGVVEKVGPAVTWFKPGDEVYGYCRRHHLQFGTYAEFAIVPEGFLAHKPRSLSFEEAAAVPLAALTAHQALDALGLRGGETLFVGGGAGRRRALRRPARRRARRARDRDRVRAQPRLPPRARRRADRLPRPTTSPSASASSPAGEARRGARPVRRRRARAVAYASCAAAAGWPRSRSRRPSRARATSPLHLRAPRRRPARPSSRA